MAKELPPYVSATGLLQELFKKIQEAPPPSRFSQDFLFTNLKFNKSGSTIPFIPFLKRIGFISNDGTPTEIYKQFRNPDIKISGNAMAQAFTIAYKDLYSRNEYWHKLSKEDLKNFLVEKLELDTKNEALKKLISTIETLKKYTDFENLSQKLNEVVTELENKEPEPEPQVKKNTAKISHQDDSIDSINLSYTINLNLPETSDIAVFNAIFKSLKEHLLKK
ncbi:hypothetical protein Q765_16520 [Flavobacterium rivuli WB 3.3-2 = DSM 21788]|uniref:DUF5343 domain-containing protein n=1 Tax=Flavobacterium rivuli WB 3.3-2 = DSM 21788 TaxID=1121895 RepID=A0A0A2LZ95_9FLAO|nr:DUF5343 domain-containing protein [Flavobacterium rivuli]KGO85349.1 hypothetical protein Q765_16520 [Flavobacterium rivuli WB 3.3-2 = DSM 21788]